MHARADHREAASRSRVPMLDVLRGLAVLAVFVQHLGDRYRPMAVERLSAVLPHAVSGWLKLLLERGHWGVDLFFVLSGFTLGMGFVREHDRGSVRGAGHFLLRRAARILPAFYAAVLIHLLFNSAVLHAPGIGQALAVHALLLQGYWSPGHITLIGASWSLSTESHFYLVAPWLAKWLLSKRSSTLWIVAGCCVAVWLLRGLLHDLALDPASPQGMLELSQRKWAICRIDQFILGMGASVLHARFSSRVRSPRATACALMAMGVALLGVAAPLDAATWASRGGHPAYALISIAMTLLVFGGALLPDRSSRRLEPLRALGVVSYGFFLYHQLAIALTERWLPAAVESWTRLALVGVIGVAAASAVGAASWYLLESPALMWIGRWQRARLTPLGAPRADAG